MTTEIQDERQAKPSASGIERIFLCPGSWNLEQQCPSLPPGEDAVQGTLIHEALATGDTSKLTDEQAETVLMCLKIEAELLAKTFPGDADIQTITEQRMWVDEIYSGKADQIHVQGEKALIVDYKTSRGEVESAERNPQLRALAALAYANLDVTEVTTAIIQPWVKQQVSVCFYGKASLELASAEILHAITEAQKPDAPRIPGERQCKYCRALSVCPEAKAVVTQASKYPRERFECGIEPARIAQFLDTCALAERVIDSFRTWAKESLEADPNSIPGWRLKPGAVKSTITDVRPIYTRLKDYGVAPEEFAEIVKVTKKDLTALVKGKTALKGKALDEVMEGIVEGCTTESQNAPSLERVKEQ